MADSESDSPRTVPVVQRIGVPLGLVWLAAFVFLGHQSAFFRLPGVAVPANAAGRDTRSAILDTVFPNGLVYVRIWGPPDWETRYWLSGAVGLLSYGWLILKVPVRTISRTGLLITVLYAPVSVAVFFGILYLLSFPGAPLW